MRTSVAVLTLFTVITVFSTDAQVLRSYGLKVGCAKAEQQWNYSLQPGLGSGIGPIWGFNAGVFIEFFNHRYLSVLAELNYIQKGRTISFIATAPSNDPRGYSDLGLIELKQIFEYISIPVLVKFRVDGTTFTPYIAGGPSLEYLISYPAIDADVYKKFNKIEFALKAVVGLELYFSKRIFLLECRYNYSVTDTYKNEFVTVKSRAMEILFGVAL
jgi:hypothetical protein